MVNLRNLYWIVALFALTAAVVGCSSDGPGEPQSPQAPALAQPAAPAVVPAASLSVAPGLPLAPAPAAPAPTAEAGSVIGPAAVVTASTARPSRPIEPAPEPTPIPAEFPVTVQTGDGREIIFTEPPERIIAYDSAVVEMLFAIGEGHRVIATHNFVAHPAEAASIPRLGGAFDMDLEAAIALEPDLVYVFFDRFVEDLERAGLRVLYIPTLSDDFSKVADNIRLWGRIVGNPNTAERVAQDFTARVEAVREVMEPIGAGPSVFQDEGALWTPGQGTLFQEVFEMLKLENVAADIQGYAQLSPEVIVEKDPTIIIASYGDAISGDPAFADVRAVRNGSIYVPSSDALSIPGPRFVEGVEELAQWAYPGLFRRE